MTSDIRDSLDSDLEVHSTVTFIGDRVNYVNCPHVIAMVGLPARGKTFISKKLTRYLNWIGIKTQVFNLGEYRRNKITGHDDHTFFRSDNEEAVILRTQCALEALQDASNWLNGEGDVAVLDATNSTIERRQLIRDYVENRMEFKLFFVESICDDPNIVDHNIREVKLFSPDYVNVQADAVVTDFTQRIEHYAERYVELDEEIEKDVSFMKIYNTGEKIIIHKHEGHTQARIVYYLMNLHIMPRTIYLTRHGESEANVLQIVGGDSNLTPRGRKYASALVAYINEQKINGLKVWTSWLKRTIQTAIEFRVPQERWRALNEISGGICEEMTRAEIKELYPEEHAARELDKFSYRYPRGESYEDLIARLEPVIMALERQGNVLVVSHQAVLRCILAYFLDKPPKELPYIEVPLHTLIKLTPIAYGCKIENIPFNI